MTKKLADVMKFESVLPENFSGTFPFTNWTNEDFVGVWGGVDYIFPALSMSPMIMPFSPLEVQNIRKKFARDLAEREFFKTKEYKNLRSVEGKAGEPRLSNFQQARTYSEADLVTMIQKALDPLPEGKVTARMSSRRKVEDQLTRDNDGHITTGAVKDERDLQNLAKGDQ